MSEIGEIRRDHVQNCNTNASTNMELKVVADWKQNKVVAKYLLSQCLPDSTAVHLKSLTSTKEH